MQQTGRVRRVLRLITGRSIHALELPRKATQPPAASPKGLSATEEKKKLLQQYKNDDGHFSLVRNFRLADLITIMNGVCGFSSILYALRFALLSSNLPSPPSSAAYTAIYLAHLFPILGFGFDALDGKVARWMGGGSMLGQEMDSLADLISFAVAPATLAYTIGLRTPLDVLSLLMFASCGLARLARFNATVALIPSDATGKINYFEGLPVPSSLFLTSTMAWCVKSGHFLLGEHGDVLGGRIHLFGDGKVGSLGEVHVASFVFAIWGALMVSKTLRIPKF